jgi:hypothetical protein|tara:strand:+ start:1435 stop:1626 length:192 start_codon:yes stop_codon:yes gene_type:complete
MSVGNQKHYQANPESPIFAELCCIIQKTIGLVDPIRKALAASSSQIAAATAIDVSYFSCYLKR